MTLLKWLSENFPTYYIILFDQMFLVSFNFFFSALIWINGYFSILFYLYCCLSSYSSFFLFFLIFFLGFPMYTFKLSQTTFSNIIWHYTTSHVEKLETLYPHFFSPILCANAFIHFTFTYVVNFTQKKSLLYFILVSYLLKRLNKEKIYFLLACILFPLFFTSQYVQISVFCCFLFIW